MSEETDRTATCAPIPRSRATTGRVRAGSDSIAKPVRSRARTGEGWQSRVPNAAAKNTGQRSWRDATGRVYVEYLVLLMIFAIGVVTVAGPQVGSWLVTMYTGRRVMLYSVYP